MLFNFLQPLKWELKQKPGLSPPRGGFDPDDPNQQIVAEDIFDEYGGEYFNSLKFFFFTNPISFSTYLFLLIPQGSLRAASQ